MLACRHFHPVPSDDGSHEEAQSPKLRYSLLEASCMLCKHRCWDTDSAGFGKSPAPHSMADILRAQLKLLGKGCADYTVLKFK